MVGVIPFPDERGYPVKLRRTGRLLGYLACAIPADRPSLEFYRVTPFDWRDRRDETVVPLPTFRLAWDHQRGCLWADGSEFLRLDGATPA